MRRDRDARSGATVPSTVAELVRRRTDDPRPALRFEGRTWSWREVVAESTTRAGLLAPLGVGGPPHLGVLLDNTDEYLFLLTGAALSGSVIVGLNPTRRGEELARDVRHTDCRAVLTDDEHAHLLEGLDLGRATGSCWRVGDPGYRARLDAGRRRPAPVGADPRADHLYLLLFTSGTTGRPKAVRMTQGRAARAGGRMPFSPEDVLYCAMPLFHGNALSSSVLPWLTSGATLALRRSFSASGFLPDVRDTGATFANTVGRAVAHLLATPATDHDRDHRLGYVLGPETAVPDKEAFLRRFGVPVIEGYGSTEGAIILNPVPDGPPGTLGRAPRGAEVAVVDPDTGRPCATAVFDAGGRLANADEAVGELVGRTPAGGFEGYYNDPEATAERLRDGWYRSGDLAYRDVDGVFHFAGRSGDWLRVDSENFTAAPVERILARMTGVQAAAVYAVPDSRTGDQVMAALELVPGTTFDPDAFAEFLSGQPDLGTKWAPRYVRIVDALPLTATHKIDKAPLRSDGWETPDPCWRRIERGDRYAPLTAERRAALRAALVAAGRGGLLGGLGTGASP